MIYDDPHNWKFKTQKIKFKNHLIQTYSFGEGKKKVIALPAFPHSGVAYANLYKFNRNKDLEIISFDIPGWIGNSENIFEKDQFSFDECVEICQTIIRHYGFEKVSILGFSFGTALETLLAYKIKNKLEKLVYVSPFVDHNLGEDDIDLFIVKKIYNWKMYKTFKFYEISRFDRLYRKQLKESGMTNELLQEYRRMILRSDGKTLVDSLHQLFRIDLKNYFSAIEEIPIMVVNSRDENKMFRRNAELIRRITNKNESLFLHGRHEDFLLKPHENACLKVIDFLTE